MADGLCTEDTVGNQFEKTLVKDYTNIVKCVNTNSVNDTACENVKSFYIDSDSGKLCGKLCCVKGLEAKHEGFLDMPCSPADDDCRKKRCADRYDSSESSDSGVAVLSCTDCSTYSGGSTGSSVSDITEPGSPFSTASSHSEDSSSQPQPPRPAPSHTVHHPPWPWSKSPSPPLKRLSSSSANGSPPAGTIPSQSTVGGKRQRIDTLPAPTANVKTKQTSNNNNNTKRFSDSAAAAAVSFVMGGKIQQGKITEYFKAQMKTNSSGNVKPAAQPPQGYFTFLDGSKVLLGSATKLPPDIYRKLDVRTLTVTSPVKKVMLDTKTKKISQVIAVPRGTVRGKDVVAYLHNHNLNLKVSSTVVPIVKLNNMPSKLNGSNVNHNVTSLSVETALPTVPVAVAKPKPIPQLLVSPPKKSPPSLPLTPSTTLSVQPMTDSSSNSSSSGGGGGGGSLGGTGGGNSTKSETSTPGDSDSGVSVRDALTVSVGATTATVSADAEPQKSPILSQPKTIRFPAKQTQVQRNDPADSGLCRWAECQAQFDTSGALLEHLQIKHVISQATQEHYVCLWVGCKVHGRTSCSRSWLERHVLGHAGNKPFRCIVDGCGCRFSSQQTLEKHVNSHFNGTENGSNGSARKSLESGTSKLFKRNGKKLRYRRQPWSARMFDFFDAGIMEGLQYRLLTMTTRRTVGEACDKPPGDAVTLHARVLARRVEPDGSRKMLLRWHPPDIVPDEWVPESESTSTRTVSIPTLQPSALDALRSALFPPQRTSSSASHTQKHRRKRVPNATSS